MTAPAVARPWSDPASDPGGRPAPGGARPTAHHLAVGAGCLDSVLRDQVIRIRAGVPLGAVLLTVLLAHVAVAPHLALRGVAPDVLLVGVAAVAVARGPRAGAAFGFAAGLGADLFLAQPVGTSALAFTLIGHVIGRSSGPRSPGAAARRLALSRSIVLTAAAVGTGRLAAAVVATGLGGVPFLDAAGLLRIVTTAAVSASLGPVLFAAVRRLPGATAPR